VTVSTDGDEWSVVDNSFEFPGNNNPYTIVRSEFAKGVTARYLRIHVRAWSGHISLRAGLLVCSEWAEFQGHRYVYLDRAGTSWEESDAACNALGGGLVTVNTLEEDTFLESLQPAECVKDDDRHCLYDSPCSVGLDGRYRWHSLRIVD